MPAAEAPAGSSSPRLSVLGHSLRTRCRGGPGPRYLSPMSESSLEGHLHRLCGGRYAHASERVTIRASGMSSIVDRAFFRCAKCGDEQRTVEQREIAERAAVAAMRESNALLTPRQIRQLRDSLGLTPQQLGEILYGTPKGIVEGWERGRYLPNRDTDAMLRGLADRQTLERLAARAGVQLPAPEGSAESGSPSVGASPAPSAENARPENAR